MRRGPVVGMVMMWIGLVLSFVASVFAQDVRSGVEQLASQVEKGAPDGKQLRVAVADFPDLQGVTSELGRFIAGRLTTRLAQSPKFLVIERQRLGQVLAELRFSMSDLVDPNKAKQLGKMAGVEAIVVGTIADLGSQLDVDARLIELETTRMLLGTSVTIAKDPTVIAMLERGRVETPGSAPASGVPQSGRGPSEAGPSLRGFTVSSKVFTFELLSIERLGDELKVTLAYTHKRDPRLNVAINHRETYMVDNAGRRYPFTGASFAGFRQFAPDVAERVWLTFGKSDPSATSVNLVLYWMIPDGSGGDLVMLKNVPLPR